MSDQIYISSQVATSLLRRMRPLRFSGIRPFWSTGTVACTEPGGPEFESRTQLVVTDCELLRFEDCIFAPHKVANATAT